MATLVRLTNKAGRFMALCMSLTIIASCTDEEAVDGYAETDVLSFGVSVSNEWNTSLGTRSAVEAQAWNASRFDGSELWLIASSEQNMDTTLFSTPKTRSAAVTTNAFYNSFGVYGYAYNGADWGNRSNVKPYFTAEEVSKSKSNGIWSTGQMRYWPGASYRMHFFAYAPHDMATLSVNNNTPVLSYKVPDKVTEQKDLVVATTDVAGNHNRIVELPFKHILTAVKVKAAYGMSGTVKKVALKKVKNCGSYTFGESGNSWTLGESKQDFEFEKDVLLTNNDESGTLIADGEYTFMMIPQTPGADTELEVTIADNNGKESVLHGNLSEKTNWEIGHTVIYRISQTEIVVDYEFSATHPATFTGEGGSNPVEIQSYKTENGVNKTSVLWENAGYYSMTESGDYTPLDAVAPDWLQFPTYQADITEYNVDVYHQYNGTMGKAGENSGKMVISPDKDLQAMTEECGSEADPVNLAATTNGSETTANCYIVNAPGWYKFPIVYGNALKNGTPNSSAYNGLCFVNHLDQPITAPRIKDNGITIGSAELRWQDSPGSAPFIDEGSVRVDGDYIKFHIPAGKNCVQGNAVIAVKDAAGKVAWSWHIWVTTHRSDDTFQFGDSHFFKALLGYREAELAICPEREVYVKLVQKESNKEAYVHVSQDHLYQFVAAGNAPYYQHGRKDPFPGASLEVKRNENGKYSVVVVQDKVREFNAELVSESSTLGYVIQHPDTYIGQYEENNIKNTNWYWYSGRGFGTEGSDTGYKNLWNNGSKTVYDPCPAGYKIPTNAALQTAASTDKANVEYVNTGLYFINNKGLENEQRFFLQILCSRNYDSSTNSKINTSSVNASLHCNDSNGSTQASYLLFRGDIPESSPNKPYWVSSGTICAGRCILPQKE